YKSQRNSSVTGPYNLSNTNLYIYIIAGRCIKKIFNKTSIIFPLKSVTFDFFLFLYQISLIQNRYNF
ncbi:Unknown protein, partial [Striga hermonthica]